MVMKVYAVVVAGALWHLAAGVCSGGEKGEPPVQLEITVFPEKQKYYVGDKLRAAIRIENRSSQEIYLPQWTEEMRKYVWSFDLFTEDFPGSVDGLQRLSGNGSTGIPGVPMDNAEKVPPGMKSAPLWETFIPQLPGKLTICAECECRCIAIKEKTPDGKEDYRFPYILHSIYKCKELKIEPTMSPEMAK